MNIEIYNHEGIIFILPSLSYTYDKKLYGRRDISVIWLKWWISISF